MTLPAQHGVFEDAERSRHTTDDVSTQVQNLHSHTARIAELLEVIRGSPDRSDLLALNASLESTRAGGAGVPSRWSRPRCVAWPSA